MRLRLIASLLTLSVLALSAAAVVRGDDARHHRSTVAATLTGSVSQSTTWSCTGPVDLTTVDVEFPVGDAVLLKAGCTGHIGSIVVDENDGDPIHVGSAANLVIDSVTLHCYGHNSVVHQDGIQVMSSTNVQINGGYVGCYSANDSQAMFHPASGTVGPSATTLNRVEFDPAGVHDPTLNGCSVAAGGVPGLPNCVNGADVAAHGTYFWGAGGAYGLSNGLSDRSGFTCVTLDSLANRHDLYQGTAATNPAWSFTSLPAGVRANFDTTLYPSCS